MSSGQKAIINGLAKAARQNGFRNVRGTNYYLEYPETVCVVNLQKSRWGPQYYLNAGVWLNSFGVVPRPREYQCQIRWRIETKVHVEHADQFGAALDLDTPLSDTERTTLIANGSDQFGFQLLVKCESERAALQAARDHGLGIWMLAQGIRH